MVENDVDNKLSKTSCFAAASGFTTLPESIKLTQCNFLYAYGINSRLKDQIPSCEGDITKDVLQRTDKRRSNGDTNLPPVKNAPVFYHFGASASTRKRCC